MKTFHNIEFSLINLIATKREKNWDYKLRHYLQQVILNLEMHSLTKEDYVRGSLCIKVEHQINLVD